MKSPSSSGAMPALPSSPATFTWISTSLAGCSSSFRSADSDATEWISRTCGAMSLHLAALQLADEVPGEQVAVRLLLREQVLRAVLPHQLDAGLGERGQVALRHVLHGGEHLDLGADPLAHRLQVAPDALRIHRAR